MDLGIRGKRAVVGGASRGLGRAVADALAAEGCALVLIARGAAALEAAAQEIADAHGVQTVPVAADLAQADEVTRVSGAIAAEFGGADILVNNTGGPPPGPFEAHSAEEWSAAVRQNLDSVVNLTRAVLPGMKQRGWGRIINITSIAVKQPVDNLILSNSIRAAVTGFARTLANEVAATGVTVNNVMPGYTRTERLVDLAEKHAAARGTSVDEERARWEHEIPMGRLGEPKELAALVAFLASQQAGYITGTSIPVDGGWIRALL